MFKDKEMLIFECFLEIKRRIEGVQVGRRHGKVAYPTNLDSFLGIYRLVLKIIKLNYF